jgi:endoglycosylceramidase
MISWAAMRWIFLAASLLFTACGGQPEAATTPRPDTIHVAGGFIRDADGRAVILRGANLANAHKQSPYFGFQQPPDYVRVKRQWGMNSLRFLMSWAAIEPKKGQYDDGYIDELAKRIGWARDAGLTVVLDMHQDVYGEGFGGDGAPRWTCDESHYAAFTPASQWFLDYLDPNVQACFDQLWSSAELQQHYADAWKRVAERLADNDAVIGFDVINEPHWGSAVASSFGGDKLEPFYEKIVPAVRSVAPHWLAFLEPSAGRNIGISTSLTPFPFPDVVYAPHSYNSAAEQGNGFDPSARSGLIANIKALSDEAQGLGAALWIGEYGGPASSPGITAYMDANYGGMAAVAGGSEYWSYDRDESYGMLHTDGSEKTQLLDVLVRPYPERVAGDPVSYDFDDKTGTFTLTWHADSSIKAPTLVSVPKRAYPNGYSVECGGCDSAQKPGELVVNSAPAADPAKLVVTRK